MVKKNIKCKVLPCLNSHVKKNYMHPLAFFIVRS